MFYYQLFPEKGDSIRSKRDYPRKERAIEIGQTFGGHLARMEKTSVLLKVVDLENEEIVHKEEISLISATRNLT